MRSLTCLILLTVPIGCGDDSTTATSGSGSATTSTSTSMSTSSGSATGGEEFGPCAPDIAMTFACPGASCCDGDGHLWICGCEGQCEGPQCCSAMDLNEIGMCVFSNDQYRCGIGMNTGEACPAGLTPGEACDQAVDGTGCCDGQFAWRCECTNGPCHWERQDCQFNPMCGDPIVGETGGPATGSTGGSSGGSSGSTGA